MQQVSSRCTAQALPSPHLRQLLLVLLLLLLALLLTLLQLRVQLAPVHAAGHVLVAVVPSVGLQGGKCWRGSGAGMVQEAWCRRQRAQWTWQASQMLAVQHTRHWCAQE